MGPGDITIFVIHLVVAILLVVAGIPFGLGMVPPNSVCGFRTPKTLQSPEVWYAANRVAGWWSIVTGVALAGVAISTFFAGLGLPATPLINLVPLAVGIASTIIHGTLVIWRLTRSRSEDGPGRVSE
jgi:uncharacterized membrane protein